MKKIEQLSKQTIDQIAAGEVVERPASVVKELVENAVDAGAGAVTVEIKDGGISLIRVTDNGEGIEAEEVPKAFLRHATSKIRSLEDLEQIASFGFRGEALSSIGSVSRMELITRTPDALLGTRYLFEGGEELSLEEIGAPQGSTFLVRELFYNTPARRKFLKSPATEAGYISDMMEHLALSHPDVSFKFISNGQIRLHTSGNHNLKDLIYTIYGRDTAKNLLEVDESRENIRLHGYIGNPSISRGNRNYEHYFVNGRFVRSTILSKAIEEGYQSHLMQHRFPFTVLQIELGGTMVDVNVHPAKMEIRFADNAGIYQFLAETVRNTLLREENIPTSRAGSEKEIRRELARENRAVRDEWKKDRDNLPEPFENIRRNILAEHKSPYEPKYSYRNQAKTDLPSFGEGRSIFPPAAASSKEPGQALPAEEPEYASPEQVVKSPVIPEHSDFGKTAADPVPDEAKHNVSGLTIPEKSASARQTGSPSVQAQPEQQSLFDDGRFLSRNHVAEHRLIGQVFDTYWIVQFRGQMYIIDQHAAHEKVLYERLCAQMKTQEHASQQISPPVIISLSLQEENLLHAYMEDFVRIGFEISHFGGREYAISGVPLTLYGLTDRELFTQMLDSLGEAGTKPDQTVINEKLATMACKAAVKGNNRLSATEANALISELLELENPYQCPHGRPTIISFSRQELEKKFKRIV